MKQLFYPREWFFIMMQLLGAAAFVYALLNPAGLDYWLLSLLGYTLITCLGITVTFHRLLTHRSYKLWKPLEYLFSLFGNLGCTGSSVGWVFVHRMHHTHADKPGDPHSPVTLGPLGAIIGDYSSKFNKWAVRDLINNPVHRFMHEWYTAIILAVAVAAYLVSFEVLIYFFLIPVFFNTIASRFSNWIDHDPRFGRREIRKHHDQSHNVWWWSYLTFGEGWHSNHHLHPGDYRIGRKWYQFDPGRYFIELLMAVGIAKSKN